MWTKPTLTLTKTRLYENHICQKQGGSASALSLCSISQENHLLPLWANPDQIPYKEIIVQDGYLVVSLLVDLNVGRLLLKINLGEMKELKYFTSMRKEINGVMLREIDIKIVQGIANDVEKQEVAKILGLKLRTLETCVYRMKARLGLRSTPALCVLLFRNGIIE